MNPSQVDHIARLFADRRMSRRVAVTGGGLVALGMAGVAAQETSSEVSPVASEDSGVPFMFVQTFGAGSLAPKAGEDDVLTLTADHLAGQTVYFSDRPERIVGMVPTERFLGTGGRANGATPEAGMGFTPADPPNAALVFGSTKDGSAGEVVVVELIDPTYDPATGAATYDVRILADYTAVDVSLEQQPIEAADAPREFGAASLFIDDCPDGYVECRNPNVDNSILGTFSTMGFCYDWAEACCRPCSHNDQSYWSEQCNAQFSACNGGCKGYGVETWTCYEYDPDCCH